MRRADWPASKSVVAYPPEVVLCFGRTGGGFKGVATLATSVMPGGKETKLKLRCLPCVHRYHLKQIYVYIYI